jgi:hypothetical protein
MFEVPGSDILSVCIDEEMIVGDKPIAYVRAIEHNEQKPVEQNEPKNTQFQGNDLETSEVRSHSFTKL